MERGAQKLTSWLLKHRYVALCTALVVLMLRQTLQGRWVGDFWEHSAVVRELATHLVQPRHPQLLLNAPHALVSPYSVAVAVLTRALHGDVVLALASMGMVNLVLLLVGLRGFVHAAAPKCSEGTAFYTLLLTLFAWGTGVWIFSGFFHLGVLGYVLPYPSTFAVALTLNALWLNQRRIDTAQRIGLVPIFVIAVVVLISHPVTFFLLAAGLAAQACAARRPEILVSSSLLVMAFAAAACWPYFPVIRLFLGEVRVYDAENLVMYQQVLSRAWPPLLGVPLFAAALWRNWRQPVGLMGVILVGLYALGGVTGRYSYGRVLPQAALLLHFTLAQHLALLEARFAGAGGARWFRELLIPVTVTALALYLGWPLLNMTPVFSPGGQPPTYRPYQFLARATGQYEVVLADLPTSWMVPTFGGKIVAALHPLAFVPDQATRTADVNRFFDRSATPAERQEIVRKYKAKYLLVRKSDDGSWHGLRDNLEPLGSVAYENDTFVLLSLRPTLPPAAPKL